MKKLLAIILASAFFTACGGGSGGNSVGVNSPAAQSDKFTVKLKGAEVPFKMNKAVATVRPDLKTLQLLFANYEIDLEGKTIMGAPKTFDPGQKQIKVFIENKKATPAEYKTPVKSGEYSEDIVVGFYNHDDPNVYSLFTKPGGTHKVTITSITEEKVTGSVDLSNGDNSIKGTFEAKILPK